MSRYIPDSRTTYALPEPKSNLTEAEKSKKRLSSHMARKLNKRMKLLPEMIQKSIEAKKEAKKANKDRKREAIRLGKEALLKVSLLEQQLAKVNVFKKRVYPKYEKGMKSEFYSTKEWRDLRWQVIEKAKGCCSVCGRNNKTHGVIMHVDHIKPRSKFPELELDSNNLQLLCEECNLGKGALIQTF